VGLFRRRKPLHERLAQAGNISLDSEAPAPRLGQGPEPPGWDGAPRGEPGIHGVPRPRRWDAVATAEAPTLRGDAVHFVALGDGTLVVEEDEPDDALAPLADAVEAAIRPPYRAEAVRRGPSTWAVAASRIAIVEVPGLRGDEAELVVTREARTLHVDGRATFGSAPALERVGEGRGGDYVIRASRLDGDLWEVEVNAL
jgi:hypothetical protein